MSQKVTVKNDKGTKEIEFLDLVVAEVKKGQKEGWIAVKLVQETKLTYKGNGDGAFALSNMIAPSENAGKVYIEKRTNTQRMPVSAFEKSGLGEGSVINNGFIRRSKYATPQYKDQNGKEQEPAGDGYFYQTSLVICTKDNGYTSEQAAQIAAETIDMTNGVVPETAKAAISKGVAEKITN